MHWALHWQRAEGRRYYVWGYRKEWTGEWRYGIYLVPRPRIMGRTWE